MKTTLTSFLAGTLLLVGSAMAAQTSPSTTPKPAAKTSSAPKATAAKSTKKAVAHHKTTQSKSKAGTKTVAKKNATPVTPVAAKK